MNEIKIGNFIIGQKKEPFIIGEAGINHNGEIKKAFEMIELGKKSGLNAIKFQTFSADEFIANVSLTHTYFSQGKKITESQYNMFKQCEFSKEEWYKVKEKCDKEDILFLSTPENSSDLDLLLQIGIPAIKVGSDELINIPLLKEFAKTKLPIILSTGMCTLDEVAKSLNAIGALDDYPTILLVTTSEYPTPNESVNLLKFQTLAKNFPSIPLGFSDHTQGVLASSLACAMGASVFEKHFTLNHNMPGPDHWFSADPNELIQWVKSIRTSYIMMGSEEVKPTKSEEVLKITARRSIFAISEIKEGDEFSMKNIGLRRPGNGLAPEYFEMVLGKKSTKYFKKGEMIQL
jgi:sialic acid synthase SpsE